ncbi:MAG: DUF1670 domain-containing protein [Nitrospiraceae bacterium]|nr:DUF1670 domain-containing protein [Nitrospiraceae bacterium]
MKCSLVYWMREGSERLKSLKLTYCCDNDIEVLNRSGLAELRRHRMLRLMEEAEKQGARLTYRDLSLILLTSRSTLKRDMRERGQR